MAGVAQPDIHLDITWQAWHKLTSTVVLRGRRATYGTGWRPWAGICRRGAAPLCVAGVAQPDIHLRFTWQAWHNLTSTVVLRGRRGTHGFSGLFTHVMCRHVLWSLRHVVFSDLFSSSPRLFYWPVCACYVPACLMVAPACFIFRYVSCFFRHVLCVVAPACLLHVYLPACFFFPRASACLILACFLPHTHTLAATGWSCLWSLRQAGPRQILFLACRLSSCRSCGSWSN